MSTPYVQSNYERRVDDHYPTIDGRCVQALVETWPISGAVVDCCAPRGSGIVDELFTRGFDARCADSPREPIACDWLVTNPPYSLDVVDKIAWRMLRSVELVSALGMAMLMRANWHFAARRADLFSHRLYRGHTCMRFRPWWSADRKAQPIHNYVWHVWSPGVGEPVIRYWPLASGRSPSDLAL